MARPKKEGLDYFPLDVDIFENEKVEAITGEFGIKGELIVIKLLCAVYTKGYFVTWNELLKMKLLKRLPSVSKDMLEQVVNRLVLWGFFDKNLFDSSNILTSKNIQETYFEATKRRKQHKPTLYVINVDNNYSKKEVNAYINTQSKVKESKGKKSKVKNKEVRHKYGAYKNVLFTDEQLEKLKTEFPNDWEKRIENVSAYCASTGKSYKNFLATIRNWAGKETPKNPNLVNESEYSNLF